LRITASGGKIKRDKRQTPPHRLRQEQFRKMDFDELYDSKPRRKSQQQKTDLESSAFPSFQESAHINQYTKSVSTETVGNSRSSSASSAGSAIYDPPDKHPQEPPGNPPNILGSTSFQPQRRGRARSNTLRDAVNPLEVPITADEQKVANLARSIKAEQQKAEQQKAEKQKTAEVSRCSTFTKDQFDCQGQEALAAQHTRQRIEQERAQGKADLTTSGAYRGTKLTRTRSGHCN